ncbi:MAG: hypothetical protein R2749_21010 [Acidimicrobiales bacterium]
MAGLIEHREGTGALDRLGGLLRRTPLIAGLFLVTGLSLAGIPVLGVRQQPAGAGAGRGRRRHLRGGGGEPGGQPA